MNVGVSKLKSKFVNIINDEYNKEVYFIEPCTTFPRDLSNSHTLKDLSLEIFFRENNYIFLEGRKLKFCDKNNRRKVKIDKIEINLPDITIINNNYIDDHWEKTEW